MDELLSLFGADNDGGSPSADREAKDVEIRERPPTTGTAGGGATSDANDDFGASFGDTFALAGDAAGAIDGDGKGRRGDPYQRASDGSRDPSKTSRPTKAAAAVASASNNGTTLASSCDPVTGLRIVDRRTSRAAMIESFSPLTYRSCSAIAAASRAEWSGDYLVDGGSSGRTNLATCGVLTGEVSSRLSAKTGRAFAILSLGDLPSSMLSRGSSAFSNSANVNASVTVFLFGDALGALTSSKKYMNLGYAVAVLGPSLMPPRDDDKSGGATSVTLSVNDPRQILPIGKAADCDRCKGTVRMRVKSDSGRTTWEDVRCRNLVDLRLCGGYCQEHRRQGLSSSGNGGTNKSGHNNGNMTFIQRQRMQSLPTGRPTNGELRAGANARNNAWGQASSYLGTGTRAAPSSLSEALSQSGLFKPVPIPPSASRTQFLKRAPLHMKKRPGPASKNTNLSVENTKPVKAQNPYLRDKIVQRSQGDFPSKKRKERKDILGEALERKRSRSGNSQVPIKRATPRGLVGLVGVHARVEDVESKLPKGDRPCKVFHIEGYDGTVQIPKPSKVLFRASIMAAVATPSPVSNSLTADSAHAIFERQRGVAGLLRQGKGNMVGGASAAAGGKKRAAFDKDTLARSKRKILVNGSVKTLPPAPSPRPGSSCRVNKADDFASAFGAVTGSSLGGPLDREAIFNAKSKFAAEADAQEYARARSVVQELEAKESTKEKNGKSKKETLAMVTSGWACRTCKKKTPFKPTLCIRARHDVRQRRELKGGAKPPGTRKEGIDRHGRDVEEGGLTLGSGLEWSGWRGGLG